MDTEAVNPNQVELTIDVLIVESTFTPSESFYLMITYDPPVLFPVSWKKAEIYETFANHGKEISGRKAFEKAMEKIRNTAEFSGDLIAGYNEHAIPHEAWRLAFITIDRLGLCEKTIERLNEEWREVAEILRRDIDWETLHKAIGFNVMTLQDTTRSHVREVFKKISQAFDQLQDKDKEILSLIYLRERTRTFDEAANLLKIKRNLALQRHTAALKRLKALYNNQE